MIRTRRGDLRVSLSVVALAFVAGVLVDSLLRVYGPPLPARSTSSVDTAGSHGDTLPSRSPKPSPAVGTAGTTLESAPAVVGPAVRGTATARPSRLSLPVEGIDVESLKGGFTEARTGHTHEAVDMLSPRNTAVHAVDDGTIAKLFVSKAGGNTIYEFDPTGRYAYYYAHLERYATGLREGDAIKRGQVIGYVGTSGNAPANTPHLHFAVFELGPERQWWKGKPVDPYPLFR